MNRDYEAVFYLLSTFIYKAIKALQRALFYRLLWVVSKYFAWKEKHNRRSV